jgi:hypothetical protein
MWVWLAVTIVFFSIPRSKPIAYAMPALFPIGHLVAGRVAQASRRWLSVITLAVAALGSLGYVVFSGLTYEHDHRALGRTLALLRAPGDPVLFAGNYFYDIPLYAPLPAVRVLGDWADPSFDRNDDWTRELHAAAAFAPGDAASVLLDRRAAFVHVCGHPLWVLVPSSIEANFPELAVGSRILDIQGTSMWRLPALPAVNCDSHATTTK